MKEQQVPNQTENNRKDSEQHTLVQQQQRVGSNILIPIIITPVVVTLLYRLYAYAANEGKELPPADLIGLLSQLTSAQTGIAFAALSKAIPSLPKDVVLGLSAFLTPSLLTTALHGGAALLNLPSKLSVPATLGVTTITGFAFAAVKKATSYFTAPSPKHDQQEQQTKKNWFGPKKK